MFSVLKNINNSATTEDKFNDRTHQSVESSVSYCNKYLSFVSFKKFTSLVHLFEYHSFFWIVKFINLIDQNRIFHISAKTSIRLIETFGYLWKNQGKMLNNK